VLSGYRMTGPARVQNATYRRTLGSTAHATRFQLPSAATGPPVNASQMNASDDVTSPDVVVVEVCRPKLLPHARRGSPQSGPFAECLDYGLCVLS
jgi:hypothetical protein